MHADPQALWIGELGTDHERWAAHAIGPALEMEANTVELDLSRP
jgi:hypothetical protein